MFSFYKKLLILIVFLFFSCEMEDKEDRNINKNLSKQEKNSTKNLPKQENNHSQKNQSILFPLEYKIKSKDIQFLKIYKQRSQI